MAKQPKYVGEYYHANGPLVLAPDAVRTAPLADADRKKLKAAGNKAGPIVPVTLGKHQVYVLPEPDHTRVVAIDERAVLLVRRNGYFNPVLELPKVMNYEPGWTTEAWQPTKLKLVVPQGGLLLYDAIAQFPDAEYGESKSRGREHLRLGLRPGTYIVEHVPEQKFARNFCVSLLYIHPADHRPELGAKTPKPGVPAPLAIAKQTAAAAKKLKFVESDGGPFVFLPERVASSWLGIAGKDYDRACGVRGMVGSLAVGDAKAVVLTTPDSTAACLHDDSVLLLRWIGADHAAALLAAATGPGEYKRTKLEVESRGEPWILMDSGEDGRALKKADKSNWTRFVVPKGRYRLEEMKEWNGDVLLAGKKSEAMASAVRLVRVTAR